MFKQIKTAENTYNNFITSYVCVCLNDTGIFKTLNENEYVTVNDVDNRYNQKKIQNILDISNALEIVSKNDSTKYTITAYGKDLYKNIGFFTWAAGGYSTFLKNMSNILLQDGINLKNFIDGEYVSKGSNECNQVFMCGIIDRVIDRIPFSKMIDLGCGNGKGLIHQLKRNKNIKGIGFDINSDSIELALENRRRENLDDRLDFYCKDVFNILNDSEYVFEDVDVVTSYMMFHDLMNIEGLKNDIFSKLRSVFPNAKYYIINSSLSFKRR